MNIIFDTAEIKEIAKWNKILPEVNSITTNPHLLKKASINSEEKLYKLLEEIEVLIPDVNFFFQCFSIDDINSMIKLREKFINMNFISKITITPQFYDLIRYAQERDFETAATTCYDLVQIHQACEMDMTYSMVYYAKNDNKNLLQDVITMIKSGIDCATIPPNVLDLIFTNVSAECDVKSILER